MESDLPPAEELAGVLSLHSDYEDEPDFVDTNCLFEEEGLLENKAKRKNIVKKNHYFKSIEATEKMYKKLFLDKLKLLTGQCHLNNGFQVVVLVANVASEDTRTRFNVIGSQPLKRVVKKFERRIMENLTSALDNDSDEQVHNVFHLPPLVFKGIRTSVGQMSQSQLRTFIPTIIKYSTGRQTPMYGRHGKKPCWWPDCVPWKNIRFDTRQPNEKLKLPWTKALRQVVINCYTYHDRLDLLSCESDNFGSGDIGTGLFDRTDDDFFKVEVSSDKATDECSEHDIKTEDFEIISIDEDSDIGLIKQECVDIPSDGDCFE